MKSKYLNNEKLNISIMHICRGIFTFMFNWLKLIRISSVNYVKGESWKKKYARRAEPINSFECQWYFFGNTENDIANAELHEKKKIFSMYWAKTPLFSVVLFEHEKQIKPISFFFLSVELQKKYELVLIFLPSYLLSV